MKAKAKCKICNEEVYEDCYGCITAGTLVSHGHFAKEGEGHFEEDMTSIIQENIDWEIIEE